MSFIIIIIIIIIIIGIKNYYFPYRINQVIFEIEMQCVFCDVQAGRSGDRFPAGTRDFPPFGKSRPTLGPIRPPSQYVSGTFSSRVKRPGREDNCSPPCSEGVHNRRS